MASLPEQEERLTEREVDDEESGSFMTLSYQTTEIDNNVQSDKGDNAQKILHNGQVLIHKENKKYTIDGKIFHDGRKK